jgi:uncharacterized protein (DUF3084 family)
MTSAFILVFSVLILGGIIATLGDRLGSKVGKARLRLFNLRPKQTAVLVTVMTGTLISASTLGLLFGLSKSLRQGVFQLDEILAKRRQELDEVTKEKESVETKLKLAQQNQQTAQRELEETEKKFAATQGQLDKFRKQAASLQQEIRGLATEQQKLKTQRDDLAKQQELLEAQLGKQQQIIATRTQQIDSLTGQRDTLQQEISNRDQLIANLDEAIADKDQVLKNVETQITRLQDQVDLLQASYINFRSGNVALTTGEVLAFGVVRILDRNVAKQAIDQLLREANRNAIAATDPTDIDENDRVVMITNSQVEELVAKIQDGKDYVVRILSAGNYLRGENQVQVFSDAVLRQQIFARGEIIASLSLEDLSTQNPAAARRPIDFLLGAAQFRARQAGVLGDIQVQDGELTHITAFATEINQSTVPITDIRAIALQDTDNAGPLRLELVALSNGKVIFRR